MAAITAKKLPTRYVNHPPPPERFDRAKVHERLFALPLPPPANEHGGGRPYPTHTPLGRIMRLKRLRIRDVQCLHYRTMSDYLAGRREMLPRHRMVLAEELGVDPRVL